MITIETTIKTRTCKNPECDIVFIVSKTHRKYCSFECMDKVNNYKKGVTRAKGFSLEHDRIRYRKLVGLSDNPRTYKPKICVACGEQYTPIGSNQKYCDPECVIEHG